MDIFSILTMAGGLAMFLYGMEMMGQGLTKLSGGKMEMILEKMTGNIFTAVLLGTAVTAVIQSSSATTVMVVGFVNSGIMKLSQAVGVIMGANIGTTVTSWILSLTGIQSTNFFVRLLKPSSFSPVLAVIGIAFMMFSKSEKKRNIGTVLVGFAILMFGMETMSNTVKPLADVPEFTNILLMFSNPILGMLMGLVLTAIIQSSSASVGILQSLCATGAVTYGVAIPIIMGQNIGTCVTALLSGIGASKNAKRAALIHLYFNVIGTFLFMTVFYGLNAFVHFGFVNAVSSAAGIAVIHTFFNLATTAVLLPFHNQLVKLATMSIPVTDEEIIEDRDRQDALETLSLLDERFLQEPGIAVDNCRQVLVKMAELSARAMNTAMDSLMEFDEDEIKLVFDLETDIDRYEDALGSYLVKLNTESLSQNQSRLVSMMLHSINDVERISDHAVNVAEKARDMKDKDLTFNGSCYQELSVFTQALRDILTLTIEAMGREDADAAREVEPLRRVIMEHSRVLRVRYVDRLMEGTCEVEKGFILSDIATNYERVAAHCSNLAVYVLIVCNNVPALHEYRSEVRGSGDTLFDENYRKDRALYQLPEVNAEI